MNDENDPLIARLRAGLDAAAAGIDSEPPGLGVVTVTPRASHRRAWLTGVAAVALVGLTAAGIFVAALGSEDSPELAPLDARTVVAATPDDSMHPAVAGRDQLYRAVAMVLESQDHGPQLCLGAIGTSSYPPQCGGLDITNWDWKGLASERASGTRWGEYVVVGTYDREQETFTLTNTARDAQPGDYTAGPEPDFSAPCEAPEGGWPAAKESDLTDAAGQIQTLRAPAGTTGPSSPDDAIEGFGGLWLSRDPYVLNVRIKGDLESADNTIREFYDGPLCLVPSTRTLGDLQRIQDEINADWQYVMTSTGQDVVAGQVSVELFAPNPEVEQRLADRYGDAVSVTVTRLVPI